MKRRQLLQGAAISGAVLILPGAARANSDRRARTGVKALDHDYPRAQGSLLTFRARCNDGKSLALIQAAASTMLAGGPVLAVMCENECTWARDWMVSHITTTPYNEVQDNRGIVPMLPGLPPWTAFPNAAGVHAVEGSVMAFYNRHGVMPAAITVDYVDRLAHGAGGRAGTLVQLHALGAKYGCAVITAAQRLDRSWSDAEVLPGLVADISWENNRVNGALVLSEGGEDLHTYKIEADWTVAAITSV